MITGILALGVIASLRGNASNEISLGERRKATELPPLSEGLKVDPDPTPPAPADTDKMDALSDPDVVKLLTRAKMPSHIVHHFVFDLHHTRLPVGTGGELELGGHFFTSKGKTPDCIRLLGGLYVSGGLLQGKKNRPDGLITVHFDLAKGAHVAEPHPRFLVILNAKASSSLKQEAPIRAGETSGLKKFLGYLNYSNLEPGGQLYFAEDYDPSAYRYAYFQDRGPSFQPLYIPRVDVYEVSK